MTGMRFSDELRQFATVDWDAAATHGFVRELFAGTLPDEDLAAYLVQDYRFADGFMALIGEAVATVDNYRSRHRFAQFLGEIAGDEDTYFTDAMEELAVHGSGAARRDAVPDTDATAAFRALFIDAVETRSYAAVVAVITVCEWLYLDWATRDSNRGCAPGGRPERWVHAEWVRLHDYPDFHELVAFLRSELDRAGAASPADAALAREYFLRTVALERAFFDTHYQGS